MALKFDDTDDKVQDRMIHESIILGRIESEMAKYNSHVVMNYADVEYPRTKEQYLNYSLLDRKGFLSSINNHLKKTYGVKLQYKRSDYHNNRHVITIRFFPIDDEHCTIIQCTLYLWEYNLGTSHIIGFDNIMKIIIKHILWYQWYKEENIKQNDFYIMFNLVDYFGGSPKGNIPIDFDKSFKYYEPFDIQSFLEVLEDSNK